MILTIDQHGRVEMLAGHGLDLSDEGTARHRRASFVEPCSWAARIAFHAVRRLVRDESTLAAWTRRWPCWWRVRLISGPQAGLALPGRWRDRTAAIAAEVAWIEEHWLS